MKPLINPIFQTSNFEIKDDRVWSYSRSANPTRTQLESELARLENAKHGMAFATGLAAVDAVMRLFEAGDEILCYQDLYGGSYRLFEKVHTDKVFKYFGGKYPLSKEEEPSQYSFITEKCKAVYIETPTNPTLQTVDIRRMAEIAKKRGILLIVDNTIATPYYQNPLDLGADIVIHSVSKYINGHGDVVMGAVCLNNDEIYDKLSFIQRMAGAIPGPQDCWLVSRGLKTLQVRMDRITETSRQMAEFLSKHPKVASVSYPGFSGVISISLKENTEKEALRVCNATKTFTFAVSLGGCSSLITHCATTNNVIMDRETRLKIGVTDSLLRLSIGLEGPQELINDLNQAL